MKFLIVCVNYNSYDSLSTYLKSVEYAAYKAMADVTVLVADNSEQKIPEKKNYNFETIKVSYYDFQNLGYFGSAFSIINKQNNLDEYDYILITNVDLCLDESFFMELQKIKKDESVGWIVPDIYSSSKDSHYNPYRVSRFSRFNLTVLLYLYKYPVLIHLYKTTVHKIKLKKHDYCENRKQIYAGHGSCFIFSSKFMKIKLFDNYPCFLFGEEIFIAEELRKIHMTTWYEPSLKVYDYDHVSTSKMKKKSYYNANIQSIKYLRDTYFN